jgi:DNA-directed RNA polymerase specialized sigma24 family protein
MSEDERPGEERGRDELIAAFAALGGRLTLDEFMRLLGSDEYYGVLVRLAALLLDGDTAAAGDVARGSLAAVQHAWSRLGDPEKARVYLHQAIVNRSRSIRRHSVADGHDAPQASPGAPDAGHAGIGSLDRQPSIAALRALPDRQREVVVLRNNMGLSVEQAAQAMGISIGAASSHLARGTSSLQRPARPE